LSYFLCAARALALAAQSLGDLMRSIRCAFLSGCFVLLAACAQPAPAAEAPAEAAPATVATPPKPPEPAAQSALQPSAAEPAPAQPTPAAPSAKLAAGSPCASICVRSTELHCKRASECEALCAQSMNDTRCKTELAAANGCMTAQPTASWECGENGLASIKRGFCNAEQQQFIGCMIAATR
jgi:hypothetical protein